MDIRIIKTESCITSGTRDQMQKIMKNRIMYLVEKFSNLWQFVSQTKHKKPETLIKSVFQALLSNRSDVIRTRGLYLPKIAR